MANEVPYSWHQERSRIMLDLRTAVLGMPPIEALDWLASIEALCANMRASLGVKHALDEMTG